MVRPPSKGTGNAQTHGDIFHPLLVTRSSHALILPFDLLEILMTNKRRPNADLYGSNHIENWMALPIPTHQGVEYHGQVKVSLKHFLFGYLRIAFTNGLHQIEHLLLDDTFDAISHLINFYQKVRKGDGARYAVYADLNPQGLLVTQQDDVCHLQLYDISHDEDVLLWHVHCSHENLVTELKGLIETLLADNRLIPFYLNTSVIDDPIWGPLFEKIEDNAEQEWKKRFPEKDWDRLFVEEGDDFIHTLCAEAYQPNKEDLAHVAELKALFQQQIGE